MSWADEIGDAFGRAHLGWLLGALALHTVAQICRGAGWAATIGAVLPAGTPWRRRRVVAAHVAAPE